MESNHKVVLVPVGGNKIELNGIIKRIVPSAFHPKDEVIISKLTSNKTNLWQPQRLLIVGDERAFDDSTRYCHLDPAGVLTKGDACLDCVTIMAAYPFMEDIPTIELSDIQEMERRGWPDSVDVDIELLCKRCKHLADSAHHAQICEPNTDIEKCIQTNENGSIAINWDPTTKIDSAKSNDPKYALGKLKKAKEYFEEEEDYHGNIPSLMEAYAYYREKWHRDNVPVGVEKLREEYSTIYGVTPCSQKVFKFIKERLTK